MSQKTALEQFVQEEVGKVEGIYYPVKAGFLRLSSSFIAVFPAPHAPESMNKVIFLYQ